DAHAAVGARTTVGKTLLEVCPAVAGAAWPRPHGLTRCGPDVPDRYAVPDWRPSPSTRTRCWPRRGRVRASDGRRNPRHPRRPTILHFRTRMVASRAVHGNITNDHWCYSTARQEAHHEIPAQPTRKAPRRGVRGRSAAAPHEPVRDRPGPRDRPAHRPPRRPRRDATALPTGRQADRVRRRARVPQPDAEAVGGPRRLDPDGDRQLRR